MTRGLDEVDDALQTPTRRLADTFPLTLTVTKECMTKFRSWSSVDACHKVSSTLLIYEIESLLQPTKVFGTNVRWTGKSSEPRNVVRRRIQKGGFPEVDHWRGIDMEHGHSM